MWRHPANLWVRLDDKFQADRLAVPPYDPAGASRNFFSGKFEIEPAAQKSDVIDPNPRTARRYVYDVTLALCKNAVHRDPTFTGTFSSGKRLAKATNAFAAVLASKANGEPVEARQKPRKHTWPKGRKIGQRKTQNSARSPDKWRGYVDGAA